MLLQRFKVCQPNKVQNDIVESNFGCLTLALPYCYAWNKPAWQDKCVLQLVHDGMCMLIAYSIGTDALVCIARHVSLSSGIWAIQHKFETSCSAWSG